MEIELFYPEFHKHPLALCESHEEFSYQCCSNSVEGLSYGCIRCQFFMHKSCVESSPVGDDCFSHKHPLVLLEGVSREECPFCGSSIDCDSAYGCEECEFHVHKSCAESSVFNPLRKKDEEEFEHFLQGHPQTSVVKIESKAGLLSACLLCRQYLRDYPYACEICEYRMHKTCAEFSFKPIQHPFHPQHLLFPAHFNHDRDLVTCQSCFQTSNVMLSCRPCRFHLCIICSSLGTESTLKFEYKRHPFFLVESRIQKNSWRDVPCSACDKVGDNLIFRCMEPRCDDYFHVHCVPAFKVPESIKNYYHHHPLTFTHRFYEDDTDEHYCDICEEDRDTLLPVYRCTEPECRSDFTAHIACALSEVLPSLIAEWETTAEKTQIDATPEESEFNPKKLSISVDISYHRGHKDNFSQEVVRATGKLERAERIWFRYVESAGKNGMEGLPQQIQNNGDELPQQIQSHLHPPHPLSLVRFDDKSFGEFSKCSWCKKMERVFFQYQCDDCDFVLHRECASLSPTMKMVYKKGAFWMTPPDYSHLLFLHDKLDHFVDEECKACHQKLKGDDKSPVFVCVLCSYALHIHCLPFPLPEKISHKYHPHHDLIYTKPMSTDVIEGGEYYCDDNDCEQPRDPNFPFYGCKECDFSAHLACCIDLSAVLTPRIKEYENDLLAGGASMDPFLDKFEEQVSYWREQKERYEGFVETAQQKIDVLEERLAQIEASA